MTGIVYDDEAPLSDIKIMNITSKSVVNSDRKGHFEIFAKVEDTLIFSSLFYHTKKIVVTPSHLDTPQVFELKKIINELDEVALQSNQNPKVLDEEEASEALNQQFKNDIKKNGYKYKKPNTGALDIMAIGEAVVNLFKRKTPKNYEEIPTTITADDFDTLFKKDKFFNDTFLILDLNITKDYKHLFFAYCESKNMSSTLLQPDNNIYLIDKFLEYSEEFRDILNESQNR